MYKMAVFDLDGTLLNDLNEISEENIKSIEKLKNYGCKIVVASGRPEVLIKEYLDKLSNCDYVIACNGAVVKNTKDNSFIINKLISNNIVEKVITKCKEYHSIFMTYSDECIISKDNYRVKYFEKRNQSLSPQHRVKFVKTDNVDIINNQYLVNKILVIEQDKERYSKLYNELENITGISITESNKGFIDVMAKNTSKKNSLEILVNQYGLSSTDVVAFGDNYNDIEMLEYAGCAITTSNGVQSVKDICDFVSGSNNDNGVAYAINKYVLKDN